MNDLLFFALTSNNGEEGNNGSAKLSETLKNIVKSPIFYVIIGTLVLLIVIIYLLRRIVRPNKDCVQIIVRHGSIYKVIDENSHTYFMIPFKDRFDVSISLKEREMTTDKLFINDGPDALYKINYSLNYKVIDATKYHPVKDDFESLISTKINDALREFADEKGAINIVKEYKRHLSEIIGVVDQTTKEYGVSSISLKINFIEPIIR